MHENWERRLSILRELARRQAGGELAPNLRELGAAVGLRSSRSIHGHLSSLREQGYVESDGRARSYRLTYKGWESVGEMPMLGDIAAGQGLEVVGRDEIYSLITELASSRSGARRFVLRARGDSMIGAGIADGDELVVEYDESPPDGTIVVALIHGERATTKRLYREGELVRLAAENKDYEDIVVAAEDLVVQGRMVKVIHTPG